MAFRGEAFWVYYTVLDTANRPLAGDLANHTIRLTRDGSTATATNNQGGAGKHSEIGGGVYQLLVTAAEADCVDWALTGVSSTTGAVIIPKTGSTEQDTTNIAEQVAGIQTELDTLSQANGAIPVTPPSDGHIVTLAECFAELGLDSPTQKEQALMLRCMVAAEGDVRQFLQYNPVYSSHLEYHPQQPYQAQISRGIWEVMEQRATLRQVAEAATNELQLKHIPCREIVVWRDYDGRSGTRPGAFPDPPLRSGPDYWLNYDRNDSQGRPVCMDGVVRTIGLWPTTPGTVKIQYSAGYTADELRGADLEMDATGIWTATLEEAVRGYRRKILMGKSKTGLPVGPLTSERLGDYSYNADPTYLQTLMLTGLSAAAITKLQPFRNEGAFIGL